MPFLSLAVGSRGSVSSLCTSESRALKACDTGAVTWAAVHLGNNQAFHCGSPPSLEPRVHKSVRKHRSEAASARRAAGTPSRSWQDARRHLPPTGGFPLCPLAATLQAWAPLPPHPTRAWTPQHAGDSLRNGHSPARGGGRTWKGTLTLSRDVIPARAFGQVLGITDPPDTGSSGRHRRPRRRPHAFQTFSL